MAINLDGAFYVFLLITGFMLAVFWGWVEHKKKGDLVEELSKLHDLSFKIRQSETTISDDPRKALGNMKMGKAENGDKSDTTP